MRYQYNKDFYQDAIDNYGEDIVEEVMELVEQSDPDGAYNLYEDEEMIIHLECLELLYYNL